jgi:thymidylate synthase (FAD)
MKKITVELLSVTPESVVNEAIAQPYAQSPSRKLTQKVIGIKKHLSCAEHIVLSFKVNGTSRLELQEHMRHRMASPTVRSTRYTLESDMNEDTEKYFVYPNMDDLSIEQAAILHSHLAFLQQRSLTAISECKKAGVSNDYIKYLLPESFRTSFVWTINLRSLINFFDLRLDKTAHFEIRHVANLIREEIKNRLPAEYVDDLLKMLQK